MPQVLNLYGTESSLSSVKGLAGFLCEFAPDSDWVRRAERCYTADEMLGSPDDALIVAHILVSKFLQHVSSIPGLPTLTIFEEPLLEQVSYIVQTFHLDDWISAQRISTCRFDSYSPWLDRLRQIRHLTGTRYELIADVPFLQTNWFRRGVERLLKTASTPREFFRRAAPLWSRFGSGAVRRNFVKHAPQGGIWFYSTAYNYTRIALEYDRYCPQPMNFVVEDAETGGKLLSELDREFYVLYAWSRASDIPSRSESRELAGRIKNAFESVPLSKEESRLRNVLLRSEWWTLFVKRRLPFLLFHERAVRRWRDSVAPDMLIVGNAGWERAALSRNTKEIPSVLLQHGIMHWVYAVADQPVSSFLIRGEFFARALNEKLRRKAVICNYPEDQRSATKNDPSSGRNILFITTPYQVPPLFHRYDLREIMRSLLRVSSCLGRPLVIRVHPLEKIADYERLVSDLQRERGFHTDVIYSQGPGIENVLTQSSVAVLFFSTMFLDCLRHGLPIISFGWHWFPNKRQFEEEKLFNFAADLQHLEQLVQDALDGKLPSRPAAIEQFLAPTSADEVSRFLQRILESRPSAVHASATHAD
jgi:hypothetical protein